METLEHDHDGGLYPGKHFLHWSSPWSPHAFHAILQALASFMPLQPLLFIKAAASQGLLQALFAVCSSQAAGIGPTAFVLRELKAGVASLALAVGHTTTPQPTLQKPSKNPTSGLM